jgi:hypothetical protein
MFSAAETLLEMSLLEMSLILLRLGVNELFARALEWLVAGSSAVEDWRRGEGWGDKFFSGSRPCKCLRPQLYNPIKIKTKKPNELLLGTQLSTRTDQTVGVTNELQLAVRVSSSKKKKKKKHEILAEN